MNMIHIQDRVQIKKQNKKWTATFILDFIRVGVHFYILIPNRMITLEKINN